MQNNVVYTSAVLPQSF